MTKLITSEHFKKPQETDSSKLCLCKLIMLIQFQNSYTDKEKINLEKMIFMYKNKVFFKADVNHESL